MGWPSGGIAVREQLQSHASGDYEILEEISEGQGASGVVFKARDVRLNRIVAIKCPANVDQRRRLVAAFDEARAMAKIDHPNVVEIYSLIEDSDLPFMVMEFVDGRPIDEAVAHLPLQQTVEVFRQVLRAVAALHKRGVVHRDIKPRNILVDRFGTAKVLDMGIADQAQCEPLPGTAAISTSGTPAYMAPEQSLGQPSNPAMDVFSLGIVFFELLTHQRPFAGTNTKEVIQAIRTCDAPLPRSLNPEIPGPLQAICLTALERNPKNRYSSAHHFLLDLERYVQGEPVIANPKMLDDILEHGIERHVNDLSRWQKDRLISTREFDYFSGKYARLHQREELWVLDSRRISFSQVMLHLGAWACVVSAFLMLCFNWQDLSKALRILLPLGIFLLLMGVGAFLWNYRTRRVALVLLMAASLTRPLLASTALITMEWFGPEAIDQATVTDVGAGSQSDAVRQQSEGSTIPDLLEGFMTNTQLLLVALTWALISFALWYRTKTAALALIWGFSTLLLATAVFSLLDLRTHLEDGEYDIVAAWYLLPGVAMFGVALILDLRFRAGAIAAPAYIIATAVLLLATTGVASFGSTTDWGSFGVRSDGDDVAYSFMINGLLYLMFGLLADRSSKSPWLRRIAVLLFWLTPTHVLASVFYFVTKHKWTFPLLPEGWTLSELALLLGALFFVFASVPKQMKSFFFSGLFYVAVSVVWLTQEHFQEEFAWPVSLAIAGVGLSLIAWRYPAMFDRTARKFVSGKEEPNAKETELK